MFKALGPARCSPRVDQRLQPPPHQPALGTRSQGTAPAQTGWTRPYAPPAWEQSGADTSCFRRQAQW